MSNHPTKTASGRIKTVLVVDNEQSVIDYVSSHLLKAGYEVLAEKTGKDALNTLSRQKAPNDLILVLDVALDEENGIEVAKDAISLYPKLRVLLISGFADDIVLTGCIPEGSRTAFLRKIFSAKELLDAIERLGIRQT